MKRLIATAALAAVTGGFAAPALAACDLDARADFTKQLRSVNSEATRNDLQTLRNAAEVLQRHNKDDACATVVSTMNDIRTAALERTAGDDSMRRSDQQQAAAVTNQPEQADQTVRAPRLRASTLMGADLIGPNGDEVAEIDDIVINKRGDNYVIVSFGGFLGLGDDQAAVPLKAIQIRRENGDADSVQLLLPMTVEQLKSAPRFKKNSREWFTDDNWWGNNDRYYSSVSNG